MPIRFSIPSADARPMKVESSESLGGDEKVFQFNNSTSDKMDQNIDDFNQISLDSHDFDAQDDEAGLVDHDFMSSKPKTKTRIFSIPKIFRRSESAKQRQNKRIIEERSVSEFGSRNTPEHIKRLMKESQLGWKDSQFALAYCFDLGTHGVTPNTEEAIHWYQQAALQKHVVSQNNLGVLYSTGHGGRIPKQLAEALHWYKQAAENGNANAQFHAGLAYMSGEGLDRPDDNRAFKYFKMAAKQGHVVSQSNVGAMYMGGRGVDRNYKKSLKWLKKAAFKNDAVACHNLGMLYLHGLGVPQDELTADHYFCMSEEGPNRDRIPQEMSRSTKESAGTLYNS